MYRGGIVCLFLCARHIFAQVAIAFGTHAAPSNLSSAGRRGWAFYLQLDVPPNVAVLYPIAYHQLARHGYLARTEFALLGV